MVYIFYLQSSDFKKVNIFPFSRDSLFLIQCLICVSFESTERQVCLLWRHSTCKILIISSGVDNITIIDAVAMIIFLWVFYGDE